MQCEPKVDVLLIAFLQLWLKFRDGIAKYWMVPVRQLFYFHHWFQTQPTHPPCVRPCFIHTALYQVKVLPGAGGQIKI